MDIVRVDCERLIDNSQVIHELLEFVKCRESSQELSKVLFNSGCQ